MSKEKEVLVVGSDEWCNKEQERDMAELARIKHEEILREALREYGLTEHQINQELMC